MPSPLLGGHYSGDMDSLECIAFAELSVGDDSVSDAESDGAHDVACLACLLLWIAGLP